ncbi:MAG TPA: DUF2621 family protein [Polyangiales bacterium]
MIDSACTRLTSAYALGVRFVTPDLALAERFLREVLDVPVRERGEGYLCADNGSICLWLVQGTPPRDQCVLSLMLAAQDVQRATDDVCRLPGVEQVEPPRWVSPSRLEAEARVGGWLRLVLGRTYDEDELGITPELVTALDWEVDARELLKQLLRCVPVPFRSSARTKSIARAEALALTCGSVTVTREDAVRGLVDVTPTFQHRLLLAELRSRDVEASLLGTLFVGAP